MQFGFNESRACTTKRVKEDMMLCQTKVSEICPYQMGREGQDKAIPIVNSTILRVESITIITDATASGRHDWSRQLSDRQQRELGRLG
jgi:hypothetical protein